jgi:hypothetical protein
MLNIAANLATIVWTVLVTVHVVRNDWPRKPKRCKAKQ